MAQKHVLKSGAGVRLVGLLISVGLLSACSQMPGDGLFTDAQSSACPPGCASSLKADDNQMYIRLAKYNTPMLRLGTSRLDIGGECYASLHPSNSILVTIDGAMGAPNIYSPADQSSTTATCKNGKFSISVDLNGIPPVGSYVLRVQLVARDQNNAVHINASEGNDNLSFIRTNLAP